MKTCLSCNKHLVAGQFKYCSRSCSARANNPRRRVEVFCLNCGISCGKRSSKYCSHACQHAAQSDKIISSWLEDSRSVTKLTKAIRNYLIIEATGQCSLCGWDKIHPITKKVPLEIDHIDGNSCNNHPDNLRVLCPNCHSLTPTYKALNKGFGREGRVRKFTPE